MKSLVCFAVKEEGQFFRPEREVSVLYTGMGSGNARASIANYLTAKGMPRHVITSGFAGALDPALKLGSVIFNCQSEIVSKALISAGARGANFCLSERVVVTTQEKKGLRAASGADAVEMESQAIVEVCHEANIPCTTVRVISDTALEDLPLDFNQVLTRNQRINFLKLAVRIGASPTLIGKLLAFRKRTIFAARQLASVLTSLTSSI